MDKVAEAAATALPHGVIQRPDGVFLDASLQGPVFVAAINQIFSAGAFLAGLDYPVFTKALFNICLLYTSPSPRD